MTYTLNTSQIAARFGRPLHWWYRNKRHLQANGFPRALPGCPRLYSKAAVDRWFNDERIPEAPAAPAGLDASLDQVDGDDQTALDQAFAECEAINAIRKLIDYETARSVGGGAEA